MEIEVTLSRQRGAEFADTADGDKALVRQIAATAMLLGKRPEA